MANRINLRPTSPLVSGLLLFGIFLSILIIYNISSVKNENPSRSPFRAIRNGLQDILNADPDDGKKEGATESKIQQQDHCILNRKFMPKGSMPLILLLSFPGSGNTWVRYLLERSSGIYTGSVFNDVGTGNDDNAIFRASEVCSKTTLVVKAHSLNVKKCHIDGAIILVRNPYSAILAEFNRQSSDKTSNAPISAFKSEAWKNFAIEASSNWSRKIGTQLEKIPNRMILYYENLVQDTNFELHRMLEFLKVTPDENRIRCLFENVTGSFKRKHRKRDFNPYSSEMNDTIDSEILKLRKIMKEYGYILPPYESYMTLK
ncbi:putative WSC domain-containing protein 1-like [Apostichopus japonicus]|uniref:Putative WSC domain-containing protein 1-like n=1 Tax=Stichopus japonicus TaxID=307972 RepID=A0A2G8LRB9_STIJA|nr:putative WSC domain-containing protein 1-like [Apostichopus japonicus]